MMSVSDVPHDHGWMPDPADRVTVVPVHDERCPVHDGAGCRCRTRLELRLVTKPRDVDFDDRVVELDLTSRRAG